MRLIYLDLSSNTGWAVGSLTCTRFTSGVLKLPKVRSDDFGAFFCAYEDWLVAAIDEFAPGEIMFEVPIMPKKTQAVIVYRLNGLACLTETVAHRSRVLVRSASNWDVIKAFTPEVKTPFMKSELRKAAVLRECRRRGFTPADDNEGDAIAGLAYGLSLYQPGFVLKQGGASNDGRTDATADIVLCGGSVGSDTQDALQNQPENSLSDS